MGSKSHIYPRDLEQSLALKAVRLAEDEANDRFDQMSEWTRLFANLACGMLLTCHMRSQAPSTGWISSRSHFARPASRRSPVSSDGTPRSAFRKRWLLDHGCGHRLPAFKKAPEAYLAHVREEVLQFWKHNPHEPQREKLPSFVVLISDLHSSTDPNEYTAIGRVFLSLSHVLSSAVRNPLDPGVLRCRRGSDFNPNDAPYRARRNGHSDSRLPARPRKIASYQSRRQAVQGRCQPTGCATW